MSVAVLRSLDRERERLVKRRVALTSKERKMRDQALLIAGEQSKLDEAIAKLDDVVKAVESVLGAARTPARTKERPVAQLTPAQLKTIETGTDGKPAADIERVRLALSLMGEMNAWQIAAAAGVPSGSISAHLIGLIKRGAVEKVGRGRYRVRAA